MTLVLETGLGTLASANTFISAASCAEYLNSRGLTTWGTTTATAQEVSLINAELIMELLPWKGARSLSTNPLCWPRSNMLTREGYVIYSDEIPKDVKRAQCEYAYRISIGRTPLTDIASGEGYVIREKVGPIEISYAQGYSTSYKFPEIDRILEYLLDNSISVRVERA